MNDLKGISVSESCVLVKIFDADKQTKNTTASGIITEDILNPIKNNVCIGIAEDVGKKMSWIKRGDMVLFSWLVEDQPERFLGRDDEGEYRIIKDKPIGGQIYGIVKPSKKDSKGNTTKQSTIIPKRFYILAEPVIEDFELTKNIYQIPVSAVNQNDEAAKKMGIRVGDFVVCEPYSAKPIYIQRKLFFFIFLEDVIAVNDGLHKLAIQKKYVSPILRMSSRKTIEQLN